MKTTTVICDQCGKEMAEGEGHPGYGKEAPDYCDKCYGEEFGLSGVGSRLDPLLLKRWETGGLDLAGKGVVTIQHISALDKDAPRFAVATLTFVPLEYLKIGNIDMEIGPYFFKLSLGKGGYDIIREGKLVAIIRWRKHKPLKKGFPPFFRYEHAFAWDKDKPGELLWNACEAEAVTDIGEAVQLALQDLETHYDRWSA